MLDKYYDNAINDAIISLKDDGVVIVPTDTVYGLLALSSSKVAIERIYEMKNRDRSKLLPIVVNSYNMLNEVISVDMDKIKRLSKYYPGSLTIVAKRNEKFDYFDSDTIAVRMINTPLVNKLIEILNEPLVLTSANISNNENVVDPIELIEIFDGYVDCVFFQGVLKKVESTIVEIKDNELILIREGKIPFDKVVKEYYNE